MTTISFIILLSYSGIVTSKSIDVTASTVEEDMYYTVLSYLLPALVIVLVIVMAIITWWCVLLDNTDLQSQTDQQIRKSDKANGNRTTPNCTSPTTTETVPAKKERNANVAPMLYPLMPNKIKTQSNKNDHKSVEIASTAKCVLKPVPSPGKQISNKTNSSTTSVATSPNSQTPPKAIVNSPSNGTSAAVPNKTAKGNTKSPKSRIDTTSVTLKVVSPVKSPTKEGPSTTTADKSKKALSQKSKSRVAKRNNKSVQKLPSNQPKP